MNRIPFLPLSLCLCSLLLAFASATAQQALSREDAVARAVESNLGVKLARHQADQTTVNNAWGAAGALPRVTLTVTPSTSVSDQRENPTSFLQERIESDAFNWGGQVSWTLFDGFGMFANKRAFELLESQSLGQVDLVVEQTVQATLLAYDAALIQQELLAIVEGALRFSSAQIDWLKNREETGSASSFDRLQFENALLADSMSWMQQGLAVQLAMRNLNRLIGEAEDVQWGLTSSLSIPAELPNPSELESLVLSSETSIRNALLGEELARTSQEQATARLYPVLGLNAAFGDQFSQVAAGDLSGETRVKNASASLTLNFNLFNGGATKRALDQALIQLDLAETATANQRQASVQVLRNAISQYQAQEAMYRISRQSAANASDLARIAADRYTFGAVTSLDVRQLQLNAMRAEVAQLQVLQAWNAAYTEVQRLSGALRAPLE